jgi:hypothetical protein
LHYADRLAEHVERLAHYAWPGAAWDTVTYLRQAGAKAKDRSGFRQAASSLEQAIGTLDQLPKEP